MPLPHEILQRSLMHCISIPYSVSSQSIWEYWCPPLAVEIAQWVISLIISLIFGQLFSWVSSRGKSEWNSEIHFVQGGNPGTCAQRPGREEWVSLGAVPWYVQSLFVVNARSEKLTTCFFLHFGGMTAQKSSRRICPNSSKFTKSGDVVTKHVFAGSSLDRAAAPCGGHRREPRFVTHSCWVVETGSMHMLYVEMICRYII